MTPARSFSDVVAIQKYGNTSANAITARTTIVATRMSGFLLVMAPFRRGLAHLRVMHVASEEAVLRVRQRQDQAEADHHRGRGPSDPEVMECLLVDVKDVDAGRVDRAALGHDIDDVKAL